MPEGRICLARRTVIGAARRRRVSPSRSRRVVPQGDPLATIHCYRSGEDRTGPARCRSLTVPHSNARLWPIYPAVGGDPDGLAKGVAWNRLYLDEWSGVCPPLLVGDLAARNNPVVWSKRHAWPTPSPTSPAPNPTTSTNNPGTASGSQTNFASSSTSERHGTRMILPSAWPSMSCRCAATASSSG